MRVDHQRQGTLQHFPISYPELEDIRELRDVFDRALAGQPAPFTLGIIGLYDHLRGEIVS